MRTFPFAGLLALLAVVAIVASGCSGGDGGEEYAPGIIHRLLLASTTEGASSLDTFPGELPQGLLVPPPIYPGADIVVSNREQASITAADGLADGDLLAQPVLYFIVLDTAGDANDVRRFYEDTLDEDPWQLQSAFSVAQLDTLQFFNVADIDLSGVVSIATGGDDGRTSVLISMQDAGAFVDELPPFELPEGRDAPFAFPPDVPLMEGATITDSAFFREPGLESFLVIFLVSESDEDVLAFYRQAFQDRGWTVQDTAAFGVEGRIDFRDDLADIQGDVVAEPLPADRSYTQVRLQVQINPARQPLDAGELESGQEPEGGASPVASPRATPAESP